jgi:cob(I)alamin adenosyltransferase
MTSFYTRKGDDGTTGLLGSGRVPKYDVRIEALGTLDEANAALGLARSMCISKENAEIIVKVQRGIYALMSEIASTPENAEKFRGIGEAEVAWLEQQTDELYSTTGMPRDFIVPGDTLAGAHLDLARTVVRRAERRVVELFHRGGITNPNLLRYINRLSSLCFVLELSEIAASGKEDLTLARGD